MRPIRPFFFSLALALLLVPLLAAQDLDAAARDLAARLLAVLDPREASRITVDNRSSLSDSQTAAAQRALQAELTRQGLKSARSGAEVRITLSENRQGYLWVAEAVHGDERKVAMTEVPRPPSTASTPLARLTIDRELLFDSEAPLLDLAPLEGQGFLVLSRHDVTLVRGPERRVWPLPALVLPRDPRGRLALEGDRFRAYLPGVECAGPFRPALAGECRPSREPWPLGPPVRAHFLAGRNYFDGRLALSTSGTKTVPPFYSAAALTEGSATLWILAGLDGRAQLYDANFEPAGVFGSAGSDLASVADACGAHVLITKRSHETESDAVQAYEVASRQPLAQSEPLEFPGPLTALWTASGGRTAIAIARHLKTHRYAAFRLSVSCR